MTHPVLIRVILLLSDGNSEDWSRKFHNSSSAMETVVVDGGGGFGATINFNGSLIDICELGRTDHHYMHIMKTISGVAGNISLTYI